MIAVSKCSALCMSLRSLNVTYLAIAIIVTVVLSLAWFWVNLCRRILRLWHLTTPIVSSYICNDRERSQTASKILLIDWLWMFREVGGGQQIYCKLSLEGAGDQQRAIDRLKLHAAKLSICPSIQGDVSSKQDFENLLFFFLWKLQLFRLRSF